jgi:hypothetical protein
MLAQIRVATASATDEPPRHEDRSDPSLHLVRVTVAGGGSLDGEASYTGEPLPPRADSMIESLRSVGYDLETAVADVLDNSISAGARTIAIRFEWAGAESWVRIQDDGSGMTEDELREAMRLGGRSPLEERRPDDLGRFGLGLKTASFSQCRRLTVASRKRGMQAHIRCWDLDVVQARRDWILLVGAQSPESHSTLGEPPREGGTTVLWDKLDRVVPYPDAPGAQDHFLGLIDRTHHHLAMVFHRYLSGRGRGAVRITLNGQRIRPWDPFLTGHQATQVLAETVLGDGATEVIIRPYVLPHESKLKASEHRAAAGPAGWNAQQGFYVYRNRRLILAGSWLGMFQKEEHNKLARIQLDIRNADDQAWHLDVRKATAAPPAIILRQLQQIALRTRQTARRVYGHRGAQLARRMEGEITPVWEERKAPEGGNVYRLNRQHPLIKGALDLSKNRPALAGALRAIEETVPVNLITARFSEHSLDQDAPFQRAEDEIISMIGRLGASLSGSMDSEEIRLMLLRLEPFAHYPDLVTAWRPGGEDSQ